MRKYFLLANAAVGLMLLAGCGKQADLDNAGAPASESAEDGEAPQGNASAEEVAAQARGNVSCPATGAVSAAGAPVDDVVGVRPGMSWGEAAHFVLCDNPLLVINEVTNRNFSINTYGQKIRQGFEATFALPRIEKTGQEIMKDMQADFTRRSNNVREEPLQPGQSRYFVSTMGLPGQEKVVSVSRQEYYQTGKFPTVDTIEGALKGKYGTPTWAQDSGPIRSLMWKYDPSGRLITETSPLYHQCGLGAQPESSTSLSPDCGVTVSAMIKRSDDNPGLAHSLSVASQNGAEGYKRINDTEQALMNADKSRQAKELEGAAQGADKPKI